MDSLMNRGTERPRANAAKVYHRVNTVFGKTMREGNCCSRPGASEILPQRAEREKFDHVQFNR
jgi:hypothetical protein